MFCSEIHNYDTALSSADELFKPSYRTDSYGKNSIIVSAINCWNKPKLKTYLHKDASINTNNLLKYYWKIILE